MTSMFWAEYYMTIISLNLSINLWRYSRFWPLDFLRRRFHSSMTSARRLHPFYPKIWNSFFLSPCKISLHIMSKYFLIINLNTIILMYSSFIYTPKWEMRNCIFHRSFYVPKANINNTTFFKLKKCLICQLWRHRRLEFSRYLLFETSRYCLYINNYVKIVTLS
jgi:hypothetical protein